MSCRSWRERVGIGRHAGMAFEMLALRIEAGAFTVHGFRSAFRDWAATKRRSRAKSKSKPLPIGSGKPPNGPTSRQWRTSAPA